MNREDFVRLPYVDEGGPSIVVMWRENDQTHTKSVRFPAEASAVITEIAGHPGDRFKADFVPIPIAAFSNRGCSTCGKHHPTARFDRRTNHFWNIPPGVETMRDWFDHYHTNEIKEG